MTHKGRKYIKAQCSLWLYIFAVIACCQGGAVFSQEDTLHPVGDIGAAFDRVLLYTGLDREILLPEGRNLDECSERVVMKDTTVAFARKHIDNRTAWHFSFQDVMLPDTAGLTTDYWTPLPRTMEFWIDSASGRFLLARSVRQDDEESSEPPWSEVFSPHRSPDERFLRVSDDVPVVTLREAISKCHGKPFAAKTWHAALLTYSKQREAPVAAWIINFSGLPDLSPGAGLPTPNARIVVDASAGSVLMWAGYAIDTTLRPDSGE